MTIATVRQAVGRILQKAYHGFPLSWRIKLAIKGWIFTLMAPLIKNTNAYYDWQQFRQSSPDDPPQTVEEREQARIKRRRRPLTLEDYWFFVHQLFTQAQGIKGVSVDFVPLSADRVDIETSQLKLIAFYLPQFHPIPENDEWWGRGFTEWTNVSKAVPQFVGHYQPHLPGELGFYDLRVPEVMPRQIELAKQYGIYGFCFHYYWFGGKQLLEKPLNRFLQDETLDYPFCLCWANENWTRRWDGAEHEVLMAQTHSAQDDIDFIAGVERFFSDRRYIRVQGKPLLIIYRITLLPDAKATLKRWRAHCRAVGIGEIYIVAAKTFDVADPMSYGCDAALQFPPHQLRARRITPAVTAVNPDYQGHVYDYRDLEKHYLSKLRVTYPLFRTVAPGWDNEPRKPAKGYSFHYSSPAHYASWLRTACKATLEDEKLPAPLVFVNAWNEWGEGAYLEPDRKYGYAYLHATASVVREFSRLKDGVEQAIDETQRKFKKRNDSAAIVHLYYEDLAPEFVQPLRRSRGQDWFISLPHHVSLQTVNYLRESLPGCYLAVFRNRGRDILPFLHLLDIVARLGYETIVKVHSKKSLHRRDGKDLRSTLVASLLDPSVSASVCEAFKCDPKLGMVGTAASLLSLSTDEYRAGNMQHLRDLAQKMDTLDALDTAPFFAGSMFWARVEVLEPVRQLALRDEHFERELGQVDGTLAHAMERVFAMAAQKAGYSVATIEDIMPRVRFQRASG